MTIFGYRSRTHRRPPKEAALEAVGGVIVGGWYKAPFGRFLIRIPTDTSHQSLFQAEATLRAHPAVAGASIEHLIGGVGVFQRPMDGAGWGRSDYLIDANGAYQPSIWRPTWHLSAISAPLAWGCSVGDAAVGVGVVDVGLHTQGLSDLAKNVVGEFRTNLPASSDRHGTAVAMLLGAYGGDSAQMAGVAWRSGLRLYDISQTNAGNVPIIGPNGKTRARNTQSYRQVLDAMAAQVRVVNLSLGRDTAAAGIAPSSVRQAARQFGSQITAELTKFNSGNATPLPIPLFVVAAGNNFGADPAYSYYPALRDEFPNETIVVTASTRTPNASLYQPPVGSTIYPDVAAPGDSIVAIVSGTGTVYAGSGTSFAAPLVSGVAALLFAFDSTLTAAQVKDLIIRGAQASMRTAGGIL